MSKGRDKATYLKDHKNDHITDREDRDAAEIIQKRFNKEGIRLILNWVWALRSWLVTWET
jgi:hypothetical protein